MSSPTSGKSYRAKLFDGSHLIYKDKLGGLQPNCIVVDCGIQTDLLTSKKYNYLNQFIGKILEFIPYLKRKDRIKEYNLNYLPKAVFINDVSDKIKVEFCDTTIRNFDYVLICHGALPVDDVLVKIAR